MKKIILLVFLLAFFTVTSAVDTTLGKYSSKSKINDFQILESSPIAAGEDINVEWTTFAGMNREPIIQMFNHYSGDWVTLNADRVEIEIGPKTSSAIINSNNLKPGPTDFRVLIQTNKKIEYSNTDTITIYYPI